MLNVAKKNHAGQVLHIPLEVGQDVLSGRYLLWVVGCDSGLEQAQQEMMRVIEPVSLTSGYLEVTWSVGHRLQLLVMRDQGVGNASGNRTKHRE